MAHLAMLADSVSEMVEVEICKCDAVANVVSAHLCDWSVLVSPVKKKNFTY